ncbi:hypothetical protein POSPLADRAFT_1048490 [Postia placenta MAD-698-R-SB12]|uniref:ABC transmembrane type-1 domain-containing protein n=1 Tax=Postia placenta MAD-698-R-SB12 TaxID=670580 RepID=A0A1X6MUM3_9APHY|nr:hypothetical protein POSPLADRAFT_1048490 [Postia placenta MAD-698-R-SB12]OSX60068.1 hypothetical protein POSPLADRAFT_1048490 [Postia placenta MAD-698-R-SB12]
MTPLRYAPLDPQEPMPPHPTQHASILSLILYAWLDRTVLRACSVTHLGLDDLPPLADDDHTKNLVKRAFPTVAYLASPFAVNKLLSYLENDGDHLIVRPWVWIGLLFLGPVLGSLSFQWYIYTATLISTRARAIIIQLVFNHALRIRMKTDDKGEQREAAAAPTQQVTAGSSMTISPSEHPDDATLSGTPEGIDAAAAISDALPKSPTADANGEAAKGGVNLVGKINNLVTMDLDNVDSGRDFPFVLVEIPLQLVLCTWFLYSLLGWSALAGMVAMSVMLPIPGYLATFLQALQVEKMKRSDARVQRVTEMLGVIRMIKVFGWEPRTAQQLAEKRAEELKYQRKSKFLQFFTHYLNQIIPVVTMLITFGLFSLKNEVREIFSMVPRIIQAKVSLDRINGFLHETELLDQFSPSGSAATSVSVNVPDEHHATIGFRSAAFTWNNASNDTEAPSPHQRNFTLRVEQEITFKRGCINLIVGPTGAGKTSILMALLGEMHYIPMTPDSWFNLPRGGGVAYAAQESWVQNETIRARITLARAVYSSAEILLLDDVLAALDVHTAKWIIGKCFKGDLIRGRTTHNVALASPIADLVVSLGSDGKIHSHSTITSALEDDAALLSEFVEQVKEEEELDEVVDEPSAVSDKPTGTLIVAEELEVGHVGWPALKLYLGGLGGQHPILFWTICIGFYILLELTTTSQVWFLGLWARQYEELPAREVSVSYCLFVIFVRPILAGDYQSLAYHSQYTRILHSEHYSWISSPVDDPIPNYLYWIMEVTIYMLTKLGAVVMITPVFLGPGALVALLGGICGQMYLKAQLAVKREMSNAEAPVLGHFGAAISGLGRTVRKTHYARKPIVGSTNGQGLPGPYTVSTNILGAIFSTGLATYFIYGRTIDASDAGFSLNMAVTFSGSIIWWMRLFNEFEVSRHPPPYLKVAVSLERIQQYLVIEHEPKSTASGVPPAYWPASGDLRVEKLSAKYSPSGPRVLHEISFEIKAGERIGIGLC